MRICPSCLQRFDYALDVCPSDGTSVRRLGESDERCGTVVAAGQYLVLDVLAQGCQAAVYRAQQLSMKREVALKILDRREAQKDRVTRRFLREAEALGRVAGAHTVRAFDCGSLLGGEPYLVMELVRGRPLDRVLAEEGSLSLPRASDLLRQVCLALADVHAAGFVHRDVKPANLIVEERHGRECLTLVDFGLVRPLEQTDARVTMVGEMIGSPAYISPEQVCGQAVGPATDVYAVGVLAYELVSGQLPFRSGNVFELLMMHAHREAPSLLEILGDMPAYRAFASIVARCLAKEPAERYSSMHSLYSAFANVAAWSDEQLAWTCPTPLPGQWAGAVASESADTAAPVAKAPPSGSLARGDPAVRTDTGGVGRMVAFSLRDTTSMQAPLGFRERLRLRYSARTLVATTLAIVLLALWCFVQFGILRPATATDDRWVPRGLPVPVDVAGRNEGTGPPPGRRLPVCRADEVAHPAVLAGPLRGGSGAW